MKIKCGSCHGYHDSVVDVYECHFTCEHGLSKDLCEDPINHYPPDRNSGYYAW